MRDSDVLPASVRSLVQRHVPSPVHLEALVALARDPSREWQLSDVAGSKYADHQVVERALDDLAGSALVAIRDAEEGRRYRVVVDTADAQTLADLVSAYDRVPVQLVRAVYERPPEAVQSFANAFRLQKPK